MAIENIIAKGIGFNPGSVKFIVTHGFTVGPDVGTVWVPQSSAPADTWVKKDEVT